MKYALIIFHLSTAQIEISELFPTYEACERHASAAYDRVQGRKKSWMCASVSSDLIRREGIKEFANPMVCRYSLRTVID